MTSTRRRSEIRRRKRNLAYLRSLKNKPCMDCGGRFPPIVMQFDHRDPSQKQMGTRPCMSALKKLKAIDREVAKCDVVCANCHMIRTEKKRLFGAYREKLFIDDGQQELKFDVA